MRYVLLLSCMPRAGIQFSISLYCEGYGKATLATFIDTGVIYLQIKNVLIGSMQLGTRCSDGSCQAHEDLIAGFSAIEAEAELV